MSPVQAVNLLSPARREARLRRRRMARWSAGLTTYALVLVVVWVAAQVGGSGAERTLASQLAETRREIEQAKAAMQDLQPRLAEMRTTLAASRAVGNQPDWSLLLSLLSRLLDERTVLTHFALEPESQGLWNTRSHNRSLQADAQQTAHGPYRLQLEGFGQSHAAVQAYVLRLERTALFETVTLLDTRTETFHEEQAIGFRIACRLGAPLSASHASESSSTRDGAATSSRDASEPAATASSDANPAHPPTPPASLAAPAPTTPSSEAAP